METITINGKQYELRSTITSIFDTEWAGQHGEDGNYYCLHIDHKTHKSYAVTRETELAFLETGRPLEYGEEAVFNGEKVRCMTYSEEMAWNEDHLLAHVDLWGNIAIEEEFDMEWYFDNWL